MKRSVHDNFILSYEVRCDTKEIRLRTEYRDRSPIEKTDVVFSGVEAYHFEGDNFQNIILDIMESTPSELVAKNAELFERGRKYGWPGTWNSSPEKLLAFINARQLQGYELYSSYGMTGWVLAVRMELISII